MTGYFSDETSRLQYGGSNHKADPSRLDREADFYLQQGHHYQAERLSHLASTLRAEASA